MTLIRSRSRHLALSWLLALATVLAEPSPLHAQAPADVATARQLFIEGSALSKDGQWVDARERLERSLALKSAPITHYALGVAQLKTGLLVEALENFRAFLAAPEVEATVALREPAERAVAELAPRVASVLVSVSPSDVAETVILIDGRPMPAAARGEPRLVNPGRHRIAVRATGYQTDERQIDLAEGTVTQVSLGLEKLATPFPVLPVALIGVGVLSIGAGVTVGVIGLGEAEDAPTRDGGQADAARTKLVLGDVVAGVGIAAGLVGAALLVFNNDPPAPPAAGQLSLSDRGVGFTF